MTPKKHVYIIATLALFGIFACSMSNLAINRPISSIIVLDSLSIDFTIDKVCYSPIDRTFFLLDKQDNAVHIYKNGSFHNVIGKSGFSDDNFRRLSDICFGLDGFLYALDSFDRSLKKFDSNGKYIGSAFINHLNSPERFAMTQYGAFFVFDGHSMEISNLDPFDYSSKFTFGKFQIENIDEMFLAGDYLNVYDRVNQKTDIFFVNGMLENSYNGFIFYDAFKNMLSSRNNNIIDMKTNNILFTFTDSRLPTRWRDDLIKINIENNLLIALHNGQIFVFRISYETRQ